MVITTILLTTLHSTYCRQGADGNDVAPLYLDLPTTVAVAEVQGRCEREMEARWKMATGDGGDLTNCAKVPEVNSRQRSRYPYPSYLLYSCTCTV